MFQSDSELGILRPLRYMKDSMGQSVLGLDCMFHLCTDLERTSFNRDSLVKKAFSGTEVWQVNVEWQQGRKASSDRRDKVIELGVLGGWVLAGGNFMVAGKGNGEGRCGKK